jgi:hypothetical protein
MQWLLERRNKIAFYKNDMPPWCIPNSHLFKLYNLKEKPNVSNAKSFVHVLIELKAMNYKL